MERRRSILPSQILPSLSQAIRYLSDPTSYYKRVTLHCVQDTGRSLSGTKRHVQLEKTNRKINVYVDNLHTLTVANNANARENILNHLHNRKIFITS